MKFVSLIYVLFLGLPLVNAQEHKVDENGVHHFYAPEERKMARNELIVDYIGTLVSVSTQYAILRTNQSHLYTVFKVNLHKFPSGIIDEMKTLVHIPDHLVVFHEMPMADMRPISDLSSSSVKSDCTETKISPELVFNVALSAKNIFEFLEKLPKDSLQKFTLAYRSESTQHASFEQPRVIRFSVDAKLILAYQGSPDSGLEMIHFDERTKMFQFSSIDFNQVGIDKIHRNPAKCATCHQGNHRTILSPIWQPYNRWNGFFGSTDDELDTGVRNDEETHFLHLKTNQKDNRAYNTLPWSKEDVYYPYFQGHVAFKPRNYHYRPNAHLSIALSFLKAQQLAQRIFSSPQGQSIKYLALLNELECSPHFLHYAALKKALRKLSKEPIQLKHKIERSTQVGSGKNWESNMYQISRVLGLTAQDWNLALKDYKGNYVTSPDYHNATYPIHEYVTGGLLLEVLRNEAPELVSEVSFLNFMSKLSGDHFSCMETDVGVEDLSDSSREKVCQFLRKRQRDR